MRVAPLPTLFLLLGLGALVGAVVAGTSHRIVVYREAHVLTYDGLSIVLGAVALGLFTLTAWLHTRHTERE